MRRVAAVLSTCPNLAFATPLKEAQVAEAAAKNKYYEAIYAKPGMSREQKLKLYDQLVAPAERKLGDAINQSIKEAGDKTFGRASPSKPDLALDGKGIPSEIEYKGKGRSPKPLPTSAPDPTVTAAPSAGPTGAVGELEYSGKKSARSTPGSH